MRTRLTVMIVLLSILLSAYGRHAVADPAVVSKVEVGVSTKADVRRAFGNPDYTSRTVKEMLTFPGKGRERKVTEWWSYGTDARVRTDMFMVHFDQRGVVNYLKSEYSAVSGKPPAYWGTVLDDDESESRVRPGP